MKLKNLLPLMVILFSTSLFASELTDIANKAVKTPLELEDWFELLAASQGHDVP